MISACSLVVNHDLAIVTPMVSLARKVVMPTIVRFSFRTANGETVGLHDVRVPAPLSAGQSQTLRPFPFPAVAAGTSVHCNVTPVAANTVAAQ